jgi:hypothetical protein
MRLNIKLMSFVKRVNVLLTSELLDNSFFTFLNN